MQSGYNAKCILASNMIYAPIIRRFSTQINLAFHSIGRQCDVNERLNDINYAEFNRRKTFGIMEDD